MKPTAQNFLESLSSAIAIPLIFNSDLICCISTPSGMEIQIESVPDDATVALTAVLGDVPPGDERLLRHLLAANFQFQGTRGEAIGLEESTNRAMLCYQFDPGVMTPADAVAVFQRFADTVDRWRAHLSSLAEPVEPRLSGEILQRA